MKNGAKQSKKSVEFKKQKEEALKLLNQPCYFYTPFLQKSPSKFRSDKEIILSLMQYHADEIYLASKSLKNDKEVILKAIEYDPFLISHASKQLRDDKEVITMAVKGNGSSFVYASDNLKNDREFVLSMASIDARCIYFISDHLKNDREVILTAVKNKGLKIINEPQDMSRTRYNDDYFINRPKENVKIYQIFKKFYYDKEIIMESIKKDPESFRYIPKEFKKDRDFIFSAVKINVNILKRKSNDFIDDREIVLNAIQQSKDLFPHLSEKIRSDKEIGIEACKNEPSSYFYLSQELQNDKEIVLLCLNQNGLFMKYLNYSKLFLDDKDVALTAVSNDSTSYQYISTELKNDKEIYLKWRGMWDLTKEKLTFMNDILISFY